jgi:hypothetical protein
MPLGQDTMEHKTDVSSSKIISTSFTSMTKHYDQHLTLILSYLIFNSNYPIVCRQWKELLYKKVNLLYSVITLNG